MNKLKIVTALLLLLVVSSCQKQQIIKEGAAPGIRVDDPNAPYAKLQMNTVVIIDQELQVIDGPGKIAVENTGARRTATGTLEVWATIRNRTNHPLQIEGHTNFYDNNQAPVDLSTSWERIYLPALSTGSYKAKSTLIHGVTYYMIELREGR
jgi:PBP1b-binding outer membrane lipoprotein LpoB